MHFEDIWNEAEKTSTEFELSLDEIIAKLHSRVDILQACVNLPKEQALNLGEILFELAAITKMTEQKAKVGVNVAAAMQIATKTRKLDLLDDEGNPLVSNLSSAAPKQLG